MLRPALAVLALLTLAACETTGAADSPSLDPQAPDLGEAITEPTDGAENEIEAD